MNYIDYRIRLGINYSDKEKADRFYAQIHNFFLNVTASADYFDSLVEQYFCNTIGVPMEKEDPSMIMYDSNPHGLQRAWMYLDQRKSNFLDFLACYVTLINSYAKGRKVEKTMLKDTLFDALESCQIAYEIVTDNDGLFIFPKGVPEFDSSLVSQPLAWLRAYPKAEIAWSKALRSYTDANAENASDIADKFRKTLETFFQEFFDGQKSLENYKADYGNYLKKKGVPKEISGNFETVLQAYTNYMNSYAKHRDATSDKVLEYIMYQTGNIIRLLITLEQEEATDAD